jgi:stearoyl-CoA desaturase (delta-9 desaturase)
MDILRRLDWINTIFLILTPLISIIGVTYLFQNGMIHWATIALALFMMVMTGLAITAGYHRLFAHKAYEASSIIKIILLAFGAAAFQNSARKWSSDHRKHHKFVDTDQDPYNIQKGFWWAHMGWVMMYSPADHIQDNVADLEKDFWVLFQEKYYVRIGILMSFVLPTAIAALWGDPLGGLFIAGFLRIVLNHHFTFSINSFCHMIGSRPYSDRDSSRDNWFLALVTYGEGYHNFHHKFPTDYRNGIKIYHWDPTKWAIKMLSKIGLTHSLRQISDDKILQARLRMDEKRLLKKIEKRLPFGFHMPPELVSSARLKFEQAHERFLILKAEYARVKEHGHERYEKIKLDLAHARESLSQATKAWSNLCQSFGVKPTRISA